MGEGGLYLIILAKLLIFKAFLVGVLPVFGVRIAVSLDLYGFAVY
jgi:hypothetical protein